VAFITNSKARSIIFNTEIDGKQLYTGTLYKKEIDFFSIKEKNQLLGYKELVQDPDKFFSSIYVKIQKQDNSNLVFTGGTPSYHEDANCERIKSDYINFEIPEEIIQRGEEAKISYRSWFKDNIHLLDTNKDLFAAHLNLKFGLNESVKSIELKNQGIFSQDNLNLEELESRIEEYLDQESELYNSSDFEMQSIIRRFKQKTWLGKSSKPILGNNTGRSDQELKIFMRAYDTQFKKPVFELLQTYFRIYYNPDLKFEGKLLEQLGFKPCSKCCKENYNPIPNETNLEGDDLPF
jgi:hypothetical protein